MFWETNAALLFNKVGTLGHLSPCLPISTWKKTVARSMESIYPSDLQWRCIIEAEAWTGWITGWRNIAPMCIIPGLLSSAGRNQLPKDAPVLLSQDPTQQRKKGEWSRFLFLKKNPQKTTKRRQNRQWKHWDTKNNQGLLNSYQTFSIKTPQKKPSGNLTALTVSLPGGSSSTSVDSNPLEEAN